MISRGRGPSDPGLHPGGPLSDGGAARTALRAGLLVCAAAIGAAVAPPEASTQVALDRAGTGVRFHHIGFYAPSSSNIDNVSLLTVPLGGRAAVGERVTVGLAGYFAHARLERPTGGTATVSALTDASLTASVDVGDDLGTLTAVARLPTGKSGYESDELDVAGVVASDLFPFRISNWGSGGGLGLRASTSRQIGPFATAVSLGYFRSGQFDPIEDQVTDYRPGDRLNLRAALTAPVGRAGQVGLQAGARLFANDEVQGQSVFDSGNRYDVLASHSFPVWGQSAGFVYGGYQRRAEGRRLRLDEPTASQDMLLAGGGLRFRLNDVLVRPTLDARLVERGDDRSEGYDLRVGGRAELPVRGTTLVPLLRTHFGSVTIRDGVDSGFLGIEAGLTVRLAGGSR